MRVAATTELCIGVSQPACCPVVLCSRVCLQAGAEEIKKHPWFDGINWALLRHQQPPYVPRKAQQAAAAAADSSTKASSADSGGAAAAAAFDNY